MLLKQTSRYLTLYKHPVCFKTSIDVLSYNQTIQLYASSAPRYNFQYRNCLKTCYTTIIDQKPLLGTTTVYPSRQRQHLYLFGLCHLIPLVFILCYYGLKSKKLESDYYRYIYLSHQLKNLEINTHDHHSLNLLFKHMYQILHSKSSRCLLMSISPFNLNQKNELTTTPGSLSVCHPIVEIPVPKIKIRKSSNLHPIDDEKIQTQSYSGMFSYVQFYLESMILYISNVIRDSPNLQHPLAYLQCSVPSQKHNDILHMEHICFIMDKSKQYIIEIHGKFQPDMQDLNNYLQLTPQFIYLHFTNPSIHTTTCQLESTKDTHKQLIWAVNNC